MGKIKSQLFYFLLKKSNFVPNLTFGPLIVKGIRTKTKAFLDCHCMVSDPAFWVEDLYESGANQITFHYEANISFI